MLLVGFLASYLIIIIAASVAFSNKEVQGEGSHPYGEAMPTWRWQLKNRLIRVIAGGRPYLTGYHCYMALFMLIIVHLPVPFVLLFTAWSWKFEFLALGFLPLFFVLEDFAYFIFNPHWAIFNPCQGQRKFGKKDVWWHPHWWGPLPDFYWYYPVISGFLIYFGLPAIG